MPSFETSSGLREAFFSLIKSVTSLLPISFINDKEKICLVMIEIELQKYSVIILNEIILEIVCFDGYISNCSYCFDSLDILIAS